MFIYLLIAFELLILYLAYYFLFLWEAREVRINKDVWGLYDEAAANQTKRESALTIVFSNRIKEGFRVVNRPQVKSKLWNPLTKF